MSDGSSSGLAEVERDDDSGRRIAYWIVGSVVVILCIVGLFTYRSGQEDQRAADLAGELTQKIESAGFVAPDQDIIVRSLGDDGGAVCEDPADALRTAILHDLVANGASFVGRRPVIADRRIIAGQALILETYCPEELEKFRAKFDDLKFDDTLND